MRRKGLAVFAAAVAFGTMIGGTAIYSAAQDDGAKLQIAGSSDTEAKETEADTSADGESATEAAASLPSGDIAKADLTGVTDQEAESSGVAEVAGDVMPAMVSITNTSVQNVEDWFQGRTFQYQSQSLGTGVIMGENDSELLIVTNNHVVEGSSELTVSFIDEKSVSAEVKGTDEQNDLAVVSVKLSDIPEDTMKQIRVANIADSSDVKVGEQVVAIGNALGYGQSVTTGIVSALGRTVTVSDGNSSTDYEDLIQTDAAINEGNSGGALLNMKGEVIGINSVKAGASGVEGMGYAIPTSKALPIIEKLMTKKTRELVDDSDAAYLGITGQDVTADVAQLYGLPEGIYVTEVGDNTPASDAGLKKGMVITAFDGNTVESMSDLQNLLQYYKGGETINVTVSVRGDDGQYTEKDIEFKLGLRSEYADNTQ